MISIEFYRFTKKQMKIIFGAIKWKIMGVMLADTHKFEVTRKHVRSKFLGIEYTLKGT
jgi:hypothetical protein